MKLFTNVTKPFVLFVLLFALGVGESWADMYLAGTMNNWAQTDATKFVDNKIEVTLAAETTYEFKIVDSGKWRSCDASITNTTLNYVLDKENVGGYNISITTGEAGTYIFQYSWYDDKHHFSVYYPQSRLKKNTVLYFDGRNSTQGWGTYPWGARFFYKYYDSGSDHSSLDCTSAVESYVHYTTVPNHDYLGQIQVERKNPSDMDGTRWNCAAVCCAYNRDNSAQNCMAISDDNKGWDDNFTPIWTTYCPPMSTAALSDNSTAKIDWQPNTNDGSTSGKAIWVSTNNSIKVSGSATKAVDDDNMTINYDFKVDGSSAQAGSGSTYSKGSLSNNTTYAITMDAYNTYNGETGTKFTASQTLYYKALNTYSVTHTLSGVTKASGRAGDDAAAYHVAYDATYSANTGYYLPSDITVTIGGATMTKGTDYTWTVTDGTSGALAILTDKIDGNVVVTINGIWRWSVAGSWKVITPGEGDPYWDPDTYAMGTITQVSSDYVCSVEITLPANTGYTFQVVDRSSSPYTWWGNSNDPSAPFYMTYGNSTAWGFASDKTKACGITTAGAGDYTFLYNITDGTVTVTYPTSYYVTAATAGGGTVTPSSATYMSTSVGGEITATPNYAYYFNGWTSNAGGTFTNASAATTTFKPASAAATVTAAFAERTAFIEGNFQIYNSSRATRTKTGDSWQDASTAIKMTYDSENNRYYLHTYSTPAELAEQLNSADAYFYVKTSTSSSSIANDASYHAHTSGDAVQALSAYGSSNKRATGSSANNFHFTGSEDGYVIIYFNGTHVWYELECALSYYGGDGATGEDPTSRTYYAYGSNQTAASNTYSKTGYTFANWNTASGGGGITYAAGATDVAMNAHEVCLHAQWTAKEYTINLANMEATTSGDESVTVTFDASTNMTASDLITKPTKTHYDFGGYWTSDDLGAHLGVKLIDENGKWIKDVEDYTSHDGSDNPTWVHDYPISLYAKWTEHEYAVTLAISPDGSGSTSPASSTTAKYVTASGDISAIPASGYSFRDWDFSKTDAVNDIYCAEGYSSTSNPVRIHAVHDGTLTANFTANGYTVTLENNDADEGHKGTENVSVTYNATTGLTDAITKPEKSHYDFGGYYTSDDEGETLGTQLIDASGNWKKSVTGYTSASGDDAKWVYAGNITLYAKWTETAYTITPSVIPAGAGSVNTVTDAHLVTPSSEITATPANAAWIFDYWECGDQVGIASGSGTNAVTVTAGKNSTITAHFKPRFSLVGSLYEGDEGGMPGWEDYTKTFAVNSTSPMDLSRTCTLQANSTYKVQVHDNATSTNLGRSGCNPVCVLEENASLLMENSNNDVFLYTSGAGEYIFKITAIDGSDHPTLTVLRPYPVNFGQKYEDIDGTLHIGTTGGTAAATAGGDALTSGDYVTYNTSVTHTATPASGYTFAGWWSSDAFEGDAFSNTNPMTYAVTSGDNIYAKFVETSTSVTLFNDGHGNVQIGGADATSTTCGVTTTRSLTAVPNAGYKFKNWTTSSSPDFEVDDYDAAEVTLTGHGAGTAGTLTANFEERYSIKGTMNGENWGTTHTLTNIGTNAGSKDTCYVTMTLPANTTYEFAIYDEQTGGWYKAGTNAVYDMTYTNHTNWEFGTDKNVNCGITTAGKGTYKFIFNITDKTVTVVYPESYQVNYGASVGGSVTSAEDGDGNAVPNGGYVCSGGSVKYTAAAASGYTFVGWCHDDSYGDTFTNINPWTNSDVAATSSAYAKFKSTNFVIYRTGDMEDDPRAALDDVESYGGGTISEIIEFRMKVHTLDQWYSLCLPFTVNAVKVWDDEDNEYYDIEPYYRTAVGEPLQGGYYIIRTPSSTTDFPIANFNDWRDPTSPTGYVPTKNTPYIIQWHMDYFTGKYISFFGATGQEIDDEFTAGTAPSADNVVNIYGNNAMVSGSVAGAYMLEPDYGSDGAWLRLEDASASRTVLPFECYILASVPTRTRYRVIRPGMPTDDTPTGWDDVVNTEPRTDIMVYTITGFPVARYSDCSFAEAARRLKTGHGEGIYILRSGNESVKLMVGGK